MFLSQFNPQLLLASGQGSYISAGSTGLRASIHYQNKPRMSDKREKSYNQAMSEWASQQQTNFLRKSRGSLLHPSHMAGPLGRLFGYFLRLLVVAVIAVIGYIVFLAYYGRSLSFRTMLTAEMKTALSASELKVTGIRWGLGGTLNMKNLEAKGTPEASFSMLKVNGVTAEIPVPAVLEPAWNVKELRILSLEAALRSGTASAGLPTAPAAPVPPPGGEESPSGVRTGMIQPPRGVLTAGLTISPDLRQLKVQNCTIAEATFSWGLTQSGSGVISKTTAALDSNGNGWNAVLSGGLLRLGWLDGLKLQHAALTTSPTGIQVNDCTLVPDENILQLYAPDGAEKLLRAGPHLKLSGTIRRGDDPDLSLKATVQSMPLGFFIPRDQAHHELWRLFDCTVSGEMDITGSVNRSTGVLDGTAATAGSGALHGVEIDSRFTILEANISRLPLLSALVSAGGDLALKSLQVKSGKIAFRYGGTVDRRPTGVGIDVRELELDTDYCRIRATFRYDREPLPSGEGSQIGLESDISVGLTEKAASGISPAVLENLKAEKLDGYVWIRTGKTRGGAENLTRELADRILAISQEARNPR